MKFLSRVVVALALTLAAAKVNDQIYSRENDVLKAFFGKDEGSAINCAKDRVPDLSLTWSPKVLRLGGDVTVAFHMTPVEDLDGGKLNVTVWLPDALDPIVDQLVSFTCDDIHKAIPFLCPFKKGKKIAIPPTKYHLKPTLTLPPGIFIIQAEVYNRDMALFACLRATLTVDV